MTNPATPIVDSSEQVESLQQKLFLQQKTQERLRGQDPASSSSSEYGLQGGRPAHNLHEFGSMGARGGTSRRSVAPTHRRHDFSAATTLSRNQDETSTETHALGSVGLLSGVSYSRLLAKAARNVPPLPHPTSTRAALDYAIATVAAAAARDPRERDLKQNMAELNRLTEVRQYTSFGL